MLLLMLHVLQICVLNCVLIYVISLSKCIANHFEKENDECAIFWNVTKLQAQHWLGKAIALDCVSPEGMQSSVSMNGHSQSKCDSMNHGELFFPASVFKVIEK